MQPDVQKVELPLDRDWFVLSLMREIAGTLEEVVGIEDAAGYISLVGCAMAREIDKAYRLGLHTERLTRAQVTQVLIDLKRRVNGDFFVIEESDDKIVLGNRACPFGDKVLGRPSMCMVTSNIFGHIVANNLGYARVDLKEAIARGNPGCLVVIHLKPGADAEESQGREYFRSPEK